jgi:hypothetical protein
MARSPDRLKRFALTFLLILLVVWAAFGPRPVDNGNYLTTDYYLAARQALLDAPLLRARGALRIGSAQRDISPPPGHPLAGFGARKPKASTGVDAPCFARALTLGVGNQQVTVLTADLLLINQQLLDAVYQRTGLQPAQLYVTASHTHSGPGGYGDTLLESLVMGSFDADYFDVLAGQLAEVVLASRQSMQAAEYALLTQDLSGWQRNRLESGAPSHDRFSLMMFRSTEDHQPLALLAVFGAHATVQGANTHRLGPDYPGYVVARLQQLIGAKTVLFAAGAVGDAGPRPPKGKDDFEKARLYGTGLVDATFEQIPPIRWYQELTLASMSVPLTLASPRVLVNADWGLGPMLTQLLGGRDTRLSGLRLGDTYLMGFPGDYAGHLARRLETALLVQAGPEARLIATSFNGGYKGYFVSHEWFLRVAGYETRRMNFFGPWSGDYLNDIALGMAARLGRAEAKVHYHGAISSSKSTPVQGE